MDYSDFKLRLWITRILKTLLIGNLQLGNASVECNHIFHIAGFDLNNLTLRCEGFVILHFLHADFQSAPQIFSIAYIARDATEVCIHYSIRLDKSYFLSLTVVDWIDVSTGLNLNQGFQEIYFQSFITTNSK